MANISCFKYKDTNVHRYCKQHGYDYGVFYRCMDKGMTVEEAINVCALKTVEKKLTKAILWVRSVKAHVPAIRNEAEALLKEIDNDNS